MRGKFITFEGCDGVGKSTQIQLLKDYLESNGHDVLLIREPGGNVISEKIRAIILDPNNGEMCDKCEALLYFSARAQLVDQVIAPALNKGSTVICDRYIDSSIAYQGVARNLGVEFITSLIDVTCGDYMPDATIFLDLSPDIAFKRKGGASQSDRMELQKADFYNKVYEGFHRAMDIYPDRIFSVSPTGSKTDTARKIISVLSAKGIL